ncbi:SusD family protein [Ekhidna lutea]|uniref:SusD family protein n=1 Tax=Ekhidna lutea TaxID=447679 RepID=A0A239GJ86_EKHLU|nr:RagB/SusD family nutrient uptake outer membrane protein [Ekhidna lutea]SNS69061.1 SusD family protein [Ekhidna lutea]
MKDLKTILRFKKIGIVLLLLSSCNAFLDEDPDNRVTLDNLDKAAQLLTNAYSIASPNFTDWMTDNVQFTQGTNKRLSHQQMYSWQDVTTGPTEQDTPNFYWFQTYSAISHANEVLAILDDLPVMEGEDQARKDAIEAEALLTRAYGHFMLVNMFGQHFGESGDGVPYIKEPETTFLGTYERKSVRRVYDDIEDDLLDGLEKVDDSFYSNSGKYHFNRNAALAFASRFYLFKRDFVRCKQYSDELLGSNPGAFVRDLTSQQFQLASSSVTEYPRQYTSPELAANLLLIRKISLTQRPDFAYGPESNFYSALFGTSIFGGLTDERENPAFVKGLNAVFPARYESLFERSSLNSSVGFPYYIHMAFTGEEVLLNRAEANAFLGNLDESIADLQVLSEKRFSGGTPTVTLQDLRDFYNDTDDVNNVLSYIIFLERRKEFIMQGLRWFDIKRYFLPVVHDLEDGSTILLEGDDLRKALQIPTSAIEVGGLEPNPR